jgi:hypothetical protein
MPQLCTTQLGEIKLGMKAIKWILVVICDTAYGGFKAWFQICIVPFKNWVSFFPFAYESYSFPPDLNF